MQTGTIQDAAAMVITDLKHDALQFGFTNDSGGKLTAGQEVTLKTDGTIDKRDAASEVPLGIVVVGGADGERVTVRVYFTAMINAIAKGGTLNAGDLVTPNGNKNTDDQPEYVKAVAGAYVCGVVIKGGAADSAILVGILDGIISDDSTVAISEQTIAAYSADDESSAYSGSSTMETLTDNSGGTADNTLENVVTAVTGVDGTGSNAASKADVDARLTSIGNNFADLADEQAKAKADVESKAGLSDVNNLRSAYENLRASYEDLRTKLIASGIVSE